jgi:hypothetical protein
MNMSDKLCVAYASEFTKWEWIRISEWGMLIDDAIKLAKMNAAEHPNSVVAIFRECVGWQDHKPRLLYNRHLLNENSVSSAVTGFINSIPGGQI